MKKISLLFAALMAAFTISAETITPSQAVELLKNDQAGLKIYTIVGYVTKVITSEANYQKYNNLDFWIADEAGSAQTLEVFRGNVPSYLKAGQKVQVVGTLTVYQKDENSDPIYEVAQGATVTIVGGDENPGGGEVSEDAISVEAAVELLKNGQAGDATHTVVGFVTDVITSEANYEKYNNLDFWIADTEDGGKVLEVFRGNVPSYLKAGQKVQVVGKLTIYQKDENSDPIYEFAQGATVTIVGGGENPGDEEDAFTIVPEWGQIGYVAEFNQYLLWIAQYENEDAEEPIRQGEFWFNTDVIEGNFSLEDLDEEYSFFSIVLAPGDTLYSNYFSSISFSISLDEPYEHPLNPEYQLIDVTVKIDAVDEDGITYTVPETTFTAIFTGLKEGTAVENVEAVKTFDANADSYNILGQKVDNKYKGIVIQKGGKFFVK